MPALLKLICFANSDGSSPVLSTIIVLVPKFPVMSNDHEPGLLFWKVSSAFPEALTVSTPPDADLI